MNHYLKRFVLDFCLNWKDSFFIQELANVVKDVNVELSIYCLSQAVIAVVSL